MTAAEWISVLTVALLGALVVSAIRIADKLDRVVKLLERDRN